MTTKSAAVDIDVEGHQLDGTFLSTASKTPGVLFVHGWGGSQESDLARARVIAGLGCICLTFDLRGHARGVERKQMVTREENLKDVVAAYDRLTRYPGIDTRHIAVVGSSYGGYLSALLTSLRPVRWLTLQVPALYPDQEWDTPKSQLNRESLAAYRRTPVAASDNRALTACSQFRGDVLIVESEFDELVPHQSIMSYRAAFTSSHSMTHRILDGADHALSDESCKQAYTSILVSWMTEMVMGARGS